jgi:hypothetical protein
MIEEDDWLILMGARKGELVWQPSLDRLPGQLAREFPEVPFSVLIPPAERWDSQQAADKIADSAYIFSTFTRDRTRLQMDVATTEEAVRELLGGYFGHQTANTQAVTTAAHDQTGRAGGIDRRRGPAAHTRAERDESVIFLGVSNNPLDVPWPPARRHLSFCWTRSDRIRQHLQALADIAGSCDSRHGAVLRTFGISTRLMSEIGGRSVSK